MDVFIRALPLCDSLRYVTSEVLIGVLHVRINHSLTHIRSIQWRIQNFSEGGGGGKGGCSLPQVRYEKCVCERLERGGGVCSLLHAGPIRKVGAFGNTANTLSKITNGYMQFSPRGVLKHPEHLLQGRKQDFPKGGGGK